VNLTHHPQDSAKPPKKLVNHPCKSRPYSLKASLGLATAILFGWENTLVLALPLQHQLAQNVPTVQTKSEAKQLFVNPTAGNDTTGNGTDRTPFKTITQALRVAEENTVIYLAAGTYTAETGETFPLEMKAGVTLQGDPPSKGRSIIIRGGALYLSPTFASQNITILATTKSGIAGVTITNPNRRGYGLWIESSNPVVADNTFVGNTHDGISIAGDSAPLIRNNYFTDNGANGMTIYGSSHPEVRENLFQRTGFGINIGHNATPLIQGNRIVQNTDGIVVQGRARPILRGNIIESNSRDGLVALTDTLPDLGTAQEPGGNIFRNNGRYEINASTANQVISAFGNQLASGRIVGRISLDGTPIQTRVTPPNYSTPPTAREGNAVEIPVPPPAVSPSKNLSKLAQTCIRIHLFDELTSDHFSH